MNNEIETVGDLIAALQRFDATLPVRCLAGGGAHCEDYYYVQVWPTKTVYKAVDLEDHCEKKLKEGDEYVEL